MKNREIMTNMNIIGLVLLESYMLVAFFTSRIPWYGHFVIMIISILFALQSIPYLSRSLLNLLIFFVFDFYFCIKFSLGLKNFIVEALSITTVLIISNAYRQISYHSKKIIVFVAIVCNLVTQLITIFYASTNNEIVRNIMHGESSGLGIASFSNVYMYILYCFPLYYAIINSEGKRKVFFLFLFLVNLVTVFLASFLIATILLIIACYFIVIETSKSKKTKKFLLLVGLFCLVILIVFSVPLLQFVLAHFHLNASIMMRVRELLLFAQTGTISNSSDFASRITAYLTSIKTFAHNFPFGMLFPITKSFVSSGGHSHILDLLARYGFLSFFYFCALFDCYKTCKKNVHLHNESFYRICWITFLICCLVNPVDDSYMILMLGPITISFFDVYNSNKEVLL